MPDRYGRLRYCPDGPTALLSSPAGQTLRLRFAEVDNGRSSTWGGRGGPQVIPEPAFGVARAPSASSAAARGGATE
jgi:hypothetical protein